MNNHELQYERFYKIQKKKTTVINYKTSKTQKSKKKNYDLRDKKFKTKVVDYKTR